MKRKIFNALFALVLVVSFSLIPVMPAMAYFPGNPTGNFQFQQGDGSTIEWTTKATNSGDWSVHMVSSPPDSTEVYIMPTGITTLNDLTSSSFWYNCVESGSAVIPHIDVWLDTDGSGTDDEWLLGHGPDATTTGEWVESTFEDMTWYVAMQGGKQASLDAAKLYDGTPAYNCGALGNATVLGIGIEVGSHASWAQDIIQKYYVDDLEVNGTIYPLEPKVINTTQTKGYNTIQSAITAAGTGDTIIVAAGEYDEPVAIGKEGLTLKSTAGPEVTIIDASGAPSLHGNMAAIEIYANGVTVDGFTITNPDYAGGVDACGILIQSTTAVSNVHILNNIVTQVRSKAGSPSMFGATGINVGLGPLSNVVISDNTIEDIHNPGGAPSDHTCGINVWGGAEGVVISNNKISDIKFNGIILECASNVQIENNTMITECESGIRLEPREGAISNVRIENNPITKCERGITVVSSESRTPSDVTINRNNFADNLVQVSDDAQVLDIQGVLAPNNTFDRAVVVDHEGASLLHTIWSKIQDGIDAAVDGDTVKVAAGTYKEHLTIDKSDLSLIGEDKETTFIDATQNSSWAVAKAGILIGEYKLVDGVHGVTVSGFTIRDAAMQEGGVLYAGKKYGTGPGGLAGIQIYNSDNNVIENNILVNNHWQVFVCAEWAAAGYTSCRNNRIANNIMRDSEQDGVYLYSDGSVFVEDTEIINNEIDSAYGDAASGVDFWGWRASYSDFDPAITGTIVRNNDITNCTYGVRIKDVSDITGTSVNYNNIVDNTNYGLLNDTSATVDATNNYWGTKTGPYHATTNPGVTEKMGNAVSDKVNFSPWLYKTQENFISGAPCFRGSVVLGNVAAEVLEAEGSYAGGWNTFSTPILLDGSADNVSELLSLAADSGLFIERAQRFDPASPEEPWVELVMGNAAVGGAGDYQIKPGEGFFIQVRSKGSLPILCSTQLSPPQSWELSLGWNLVGAPSYVSKAVEDAFSSLAATCTVVSSPGANPASWSYPPAAPEIKVLLPGRAYWVAMSADGTLMCFDGTPVADDLTWELNQ